VAAVSPVAAEASQEARKLATAILEVLAGARAPSEAAQVLGVSLARYYQLELRAVAGLVAACEDRRRRGRACRPGGELAALRRECEQLRRECARQQALARATRRTIGLVTEPSPAVLPESKPRRRSRRPSARALKMARLLQVQKPESPPPAAATTPAPAEIGLESP
jgi:hypothetical protein